MERDKIPFAVALHCFPYAPPHKTPHRYTQHERAVLDIVAELANSPSVSAGQAGNTETQSNNLKTDGRGETALAAQAWLRLHAGQLPGAFHMRKVLGVARTTAATYLRLVRDFMQYASTVLDADPWVALSDVEMFIGFVEFRRATGKGWSAATAAQHVDVFPTACRFLGLPYPPELQGTELARVRRSFLREAPGEGASPRQAAGVAEVQAAVSRLREHHCELAVEAQCVLHFSLYALLRAGESKKLEVSRARAQVGEASLSFLFHDKTHLKGWRRAVWRPTLQANDRAQFDWTRDLGALLLAAGSYSMHYDLRWKRKPQAPRTHLGRGVQLSADVRTHSGRERLGSPVPPGLAHYVGCRGARLGRVH